MRRMHVCGFLMVVLPVAWLTWEYNHDPCLKQGSDWAVCRAASANLPMVGHGY